MTWTITLTKEQLAHANDYGEWRDFTMRNRKNAIGYLRANDHAEQERQGTAAEIAVAIALDVPWRPNLWDSDGGNDDLPGWHVRATEHRAGHLLLYDEGPGWSEDPADGRYILVTGKRPLLTLTGWCYGWEGKKRENWRQSCRTPCYWVPQSQLRPIDGEKINARRKPGIWAWVGDYTEGYDPRRPWSYERIETSSDAGVPR